jgi:hypothetical protein
MQHMQQHLACEWDCRMYKYCVPWLSGFLSPGVADSVLFQSTPQPAKCYGMPQEARTGGIWGTGGLGWTK